MGNKVHHCCTIREDGDPDEEAKCCAFKRPRMETDEERVRGRFSRQLSMESIPGPDECMLFFDCAETHEALSDPRARCFSSRRESSFGREHSNTLGGIPEFSPQDGSTDCGAAEEQQHPRRMTSYHSTYQVETRRDTSMIEDAVTQAVIEGWKQRISGELDEKLTQGLQEGYPELSEWTTPAAVRRMLRAACNNEAEATQMLIRAIVCRVRERDLFQTMRCKVTSDIRVIGRDLQQRPAIYMCTRNQETGLKESLPQIYLAFEAAVRMCPEDADAQAIMIADMHKFSPGLNMEPAALKELTDSFGSVFADRLNFILIIDFSFFAQAMWELAKPMLSDRTKQKMQFVSQRQARSVIQERFNSQTANRIFKSFEINRDSRSMEDDRRFHAQCTSISDVPLGRIDNANEAG